MKKTLSDVIVSDAKNLKRTPDQEGEGRHVERRRVAKDVEPRHANQQVDTGNELHEARHPEVQKPHIPIVLLASGED